MTIYTMNPMQSGTRMRSGHDVFAKVIIPDLAASDLLEGTDLWEAPADGAEVRKGDKWLYVTKRNGKQLSAQGWTAYIHKGIPICENFKVIDGEVIPPVDPPTGYAIPEYFDQITPDGKVTRYVRA